MAVALAAVALSSATRAAAQPAARERLARCSPAARVSGDAELAHQLRLELAVLGVRTQDIPPSCPAARVTVSAAGERVSVALLDASGRRARQLVTTTQVAATWIESWVHPEIGAPLLAARVAVPVQSTVESVDSAAPATATVLRGFVLAAAAERLYASDTSDWRAVSLSACARLGQLCPGLVARLADNRDFVSDGQWAEIDRLGFDLLAGVSAPFEVGSMQLTPSFALGLGLLRSASDSCGDVGPDGQCTATHGVSYSVGPRAELGVAGAFRIASRLSLVVSGSVALAPMARGAPMPPESPPDDGSPPDTPDPVDPGDGDQPENSPPDPGLPGEPDRFTRIGVGLALELP